jgi:hypothetical protein
MQQARGPLQLQNRGLKRSNEEERRADDNYFNESGGGDRTICDCTDLKEESCEGIGEGRTDGPRRLCLRRANSESAWFCGDDGSGLKLWTMHTQDLE